MRHGRIYIAALAAGLLALPVAAPAEEEGIDFGGAVRLNYAWRDYDDTNKDRAGDFELELFRINARGTVGEVIIESAEPGTPEHVIREFILAKFKPEREKALMKLLPFQRKDFEGIIAQHPHLVYKVMRAVTRSAHRIVHQMNHEFIELSNYIFKQHGRY